MKKIKVLFLFYLIICSNIFAQKLPLVYSPEYNINSAQFGYHCFDTEKYSKIYNYLLQSLNQDPYNLTPNSFIVPEKPVSVEDLLLVHTQDYLGALNISKVIAQIACVPYLASIDPRILNEKILRPLRFAVSGTLMAANLALANRWAINLGGGFHHAKRNEGGGFCFYGDIQLAITKLWKQDSRLKVMIVDLDAHQGNGHEHFFMGDPRVIIFDIYNQGLYPHDFCAEQNIRYKFPVNCRTKTDQYLDILYGKLPQALDTESPDLIIYNAGSDIYEDDTLGGLDVSEDGIIQRDFFVFKCAKERNIPIAMLLSGGYCPYSWRIVGRSIENLLKNLLLQ